jgi:hypothetical protein
VKWKACKNEIFHEILVNETKTNAVQAWTLREGEQKRVGKENSMPSSERQYPAHLQHDGQIREGLARRFGALRRHEAADSTQHVRVGRAKVARVAGCVNAKQNKSSGLEKVMQCKETNEVETAKKVGVKNKIGSGSGHIGHDVDKNETGKSVRACMRHTKAQRGARCFAPTKERRQQNGALGEVDLHVRIAKRVRGRREACKTLTQQQTFG